MMPDILFRRGCFDLGNVLATDNLCIYLLGIWIYLESDRCRVGVLDRQSLRNLDGKGT